MKKYCSHKAAKDDYRVMSCLDQAVSNGKGITRDCQHFLWIWKKSQTESKINQQKLMEVCPLEQTQKKAADCAHHYNEPLGSANKLIPCMLDYRLNIENGACDRFLSLISSVVFSDYRLICNFVSQCKNEIETFKCGRVNLGEQEWTQPHSQGEVVACLEEHLTKDKNAISGPCAKEIVNLAELSADDFQLDRAFYLACRDDRDQFCADLPAGEGRIYQCLFKNKFDRAMTKDCQDAITLREKLIFEADYDAGYLIHKSCKKTFRQFGCDKELHDNLQMNQEWTGLADLMLCVERKVKNEKKDHSGKLLVVDQDCDAQLQLYRQYLMSDYELSPDVVSNCRNEITRFCGGMKKQGETLHCLMGIETDTNDDISSECDEALFELIEKTEADTDFHVDGRLQAQCGPVVNELCTDNMEDDADILQCLLENIHSTVMIQKRPECRKALLEVQYFLARDFSYDKHFRKACHDDAEEFCSARDLGDVDDEEDLEIPLSLIIGCLYRHVHPAVEDADNSAGRSLSPKCVNQVHRVMQQRSMEVELNDDLDKACKPALGLFCSENELGVGTEFLCLQEHFDQLVQEADSNPDTHGECLEQLTGLTEIAAEELDLEQVLFQVTSKFQHIFTSQEILDFCFGINPPF